jgi:hydrogenase expression/formation protein HypC
MCLSYPAKIEKIENGTALVSHGDEKREVSLMLVKDVAVGDYILTHGELALNKIDKKDAEEILAAIKNLNICGH